MADFEVVKAILESRGRRFDDDTIKMLTFEQLDMASDPTLAGDLACDRLLVEKEKRQQIQQFIGEKSLHDIDEPEGYNFMHAVYERFAPITPPDWYDLPLSVQIYLICRCLRCHWDDPRDRIRFLRKLIIQAVREEALPLTWLASCFNITNQALNGYFDGRSFRDGDVYIAEDLNGIEGFFDNTFDEYHKWVWERTYSDFAKGLHPICYDGSYEQLFSVIMSRDEKVLALSPVIIAYPNNCHCYKEVPF